MQLTYHRLAPPSPCSLHTCPPTGLPQVGPTFTLITTYMSTYRSTTGWPHLHLAHYIHVHLQVYHRLAPPSPCSLHTCPPTGLPQVGPTFTLLTTYMSTYRSTTGWPHLHLAHYIHVHLQVYHRLAPPSPCSLHTCPPTGLPQVGPTSAMV